MILEVDPVVEEEINSVRCRGILYESEPGIEVKVEPQGLMLLLAMRARYPGSPVGDWVNT
jgi:hypothetical protein